MLKSETKLQQNQEKASKHKYMIPAEYPSPLLSVQVLSIACLFSSNTVPLTLILSHFQFS